MALSGSLLLHAAGLVVLPSQGDDRLAGGAGQMPPLLGDSFADLSQGMAKAVTAVPPMTPAPVAAAAPVTAVTPVSAPAIPDGIAPLAPVQPLAARQPDRLPEARPRALAPARTETAAPAPVVPKARPPTRTADPQRSPRPETPSAKPPAAKPPSAKGAEAAARKGTATGRAEGSGSQTGARQKAEGDGGKAAQASYGRSVMRKIAATRKKTTALRGTAVIAFRIGPGGQLDSVRVAQSSGSAELDALGLDHIRRAAPFPPPPSGTETRFSVAFVGR